MRIMSDRIKTKRKGLVIVIMLIQAILFSANGYCQPAFYSQSLRTLYYSLPAACQLNIPSADTVVFCSGITPEKTIPVVFSWDEYEMLMHVGYRFINDSEILQSVNPAIIRFIERETLALLTAGNIEQKINMNRDNRFYILLNGITPQTGFYRSSTGLVSLLQQVSGIKTQFEDGKRYNVEMTCGTQKLSFIFVADAELLSDMDKKERDNRIAAQLSSHRSKSQTPLQHVPACNESLMQVYNDSAFVCKGSMFIIPQINNDMFYRKNERSFQLIFSNKWIAETFSNIMLAPAERNYTVQVTQRMYGGEIFRYELNSIDFFDYFSGAYERYFGIESVEKDILTGTLIFADKNVSSIHLAFVSISIWDLFNGGAMHIQLDANIPQHNIETIFGRSKKEKTIIQ